MSEKAVIAKMCGSGSFIRATSVYKVFLVALRTVRNRGNLCEV